MKERPDILKYTSGGKGGSFTAVTENRRKERMNSQFVVVADDHFVGHSIFKISLHIREIPYCPCNDFPIPYFE